MQEITLDDELKLGIAFIDNHHQKLVNIANAFIRAASRGSGVVPLSRLLVTLREHAVSHFHTEERMMTAVRYARRSVHALENERFKKTMKRLQHHLETTGGATVKDLTLLKKVLLAHIRGSNKGISNSMLATAAPSGWHGVSRQQGVAL
ncbi:hypothetical protein GM415_17150 [Pseudodesulfovibrio cashew]|uniref:Hemerythrin-like domain-containing protein n=1 Tax=Pseudodesulfovibrio cashew TaxID=2678688 RepID=A0A6I6JG15_9BACT|nr:hemerythrin family protein [Pseudodesulfovibrio cashew]QGY41775.1 hypothetical protein GM415_17150 [Pseudodesulfovibrio cashew]